MYLRGNCDQSGIISYMRNILLKYGLFENIVSYATTGVFPENAGNKNVKLYSQNHDIDRISNNFDFHTLKELRLRIRPAIV